MNPQEPTYGADRVPYLPAECVTGIEPAPSVWKTDVLPLTPYTQLRGLFDKSPDGSEVPVFLAAMDRHGVGPCSSALRADAFTGLAYDPQKNNRLLLSADGLLLYKPRFYPGIPPENKRMQRSCLLHAAPFVSFVYPKCIGHISEFLRHEQPSGFLKPVNESIFCCKLLVLCITFPVKHKNSLLQLCDCTTNIWTGTSNTWRYTSLFFFVNTFLKIFFTGSPGCKCKP